MLHPIGEVIADAGVIGFMNDFGLGGVIAVTPVSGYGDYSFLVTFSFDGSDAIGEASYLTTFDPHRAFPRVPCWSTPFPEPRERRIGM
ncbi:MAG: hypothetical protein WEC79_06845 [Thermomicrobiales bacterium]